MPTSLQITQRWLICLELLKQMVLCTNLMHPLTMRQTPARRLLQVSAHLILYFNAIKESDTRQSP